MTTSTETLLQFPCEFPIKAFGLTSQSFAKRVVEIVRRHAPAVNDAPVKTRLSKGGKYTAVTLTIRAESRAQLEAIYQALNECREVLMVL